MAQASLADSPVNAAKPIPALPIDGFDRNVYCIMGLPFDALDTAGALTRIRSAIQTHTRCSLATPNLNFVIAARGDDVLRDAILRSDLSTPDGMPIIWVARLLGLPIRERVAGSTLFSRIQSETSTPVSVYFFGGQEGVAEKAAEVINEVGGMMRCSGFACPGFGSVAEMSSDKIVANINQSKADFLVVSIGGRKGQLWIDHNFARLTASVVGPLGAVVNFVAGSVKRAPSWMQEAGLEWLWRIKEEPALIRRYWGDGRKFLAVLFKQVLPYAWFLWMRNQRLAVCTPPTATVQVGTIETNMILTGDWSVDNIEELRSSAKECCNAAFDITIHITKVNYVDSSVIGMFMLIKRRQLATGNTLTVIGANSLVRKIFELNGAGFLLIPTS